MSSKTPRPTGAVGAATSSRTAKPPREAHFPPTGGKPYKAKVVSSPPPSAKSSPAKTKASPPPPPPKQASQQQQHAPSSSPPPPTPTPQRQPHFTIPAAAQQPPRQQGQMPRPAATADRSKPPARSSMLGQALRTPGTVRTMILAVGGAAIIVFGTWYGAGLKIRRETQQAKEKFRRAEPDERIRSLEAAKAKYVGVREELVGKLADLKTEMAEKKGGTSGGV